MCSFDREYYEDQFGEIFLNMDQWFRCLSKIFLICSSGGPFVQWSLIICEIFVEGIKRNDSVFFFKLDQRFMRRCHLEDFLSGALAALLFGGAEPFVQFWKRAL